MIDTAINFCDIPSKLDRRQVPTFEPLDPRETADFIGEGDDATAIGLIAEYLLTARHWVEGDVNVCLGQRTATLDLDYFPSWEIEWRFPPLQSVTSIVYLDTTGASTTLSSSLYRVDANHWPARIEPAYGQCWPYTHPVNKAITITATIGYTDASLVPPVAKTAMRILAKMMMDNGGIMCEDGLEAVRRMLDSLRWEGYV